MVSLVVVAARLVQFVCASILLGSPLFFLYGLPARGPGAAQGQAWPRPLLQSATALLLVGAVVAFFAQTAVMADSVAGAFKLDNLAAVVTDGAFGVAIMARMVLALLSLLAALALKPSRGLWVLLSAVGVGVAASFAWTGHGGAGEGSAGLVHVVSDVFHLLAAAVWLGALAPFTLLLLRSRKASLDDEIRVVHRSLERFAGVGSGVVAVLLGTGLINSWFLIGPSHLSDLVGTPYGLLLLAKVGLFIAMLGLAAANRYQLTPRLGAALARKGEAAAAIGALRRSLILESSAAVLVLAIVSLLGTLAPPMSQ